VPRTLVDHSPIADLDLRLGHGRWPDDLGGELFISTSEQATAGRHAFFGDGILIRLSLAPGTWGAPADRWALRAAVLDTPSRRLRQRCPDPFTAGAYGTSSPFGMVNAANTAPLPWGDRLFATWDAGRPVEVDPVTLTSLGEVGHRDGWPVFVDAPVLPFIPSTAHPIVDPERGCLWSVAYDPMGQRCWIVRWAGEGATVDAWPVDGAAIPQSMHTISQTAGWLVLADCAFRADPNEILGTGERSVTTEQDEPIHLVRKDALEATPSGQPVGATTFRLAPEMNHFYAVYDDGDAVRVIFEHTVDTDLAMALRSDDTDAFGRPVDPGLAGTYMHPASAGVISLVDLDPATGEVVHRATATDGERWWATQLSAIDWSPEGQRRPTVHHQLFTGFRPELIAQRYLDLYHDRIDRSSLPHEELPAVLATLDRATLAAKAEHTFAVDDYPTSPCFVPRAPEASPGTSRYAGGDPGGHDGHVVVPVLSDDGLRVEVFDAADVGAGPVASLVAPAGETLPFLIHSAWMPAAVDPDRSIERLSFADELDPDRLGGLTDDQARAVREVAAEQG